MFRAEIGTTKKFSAFSPSAASSDGTAIWLASLIIDVTP